VADAGPGRREAQLVEPLLVEDLGHQPHVLLDADLVATCHADAAGLLTTVLQGEHPEVHQGRHVDRSRHVHGDHATLLARLVPGARMIGPDQDR